MARLLIQFPGSTTATVSAETLPKNVIVVDEDLHQLRVHDGVTPGGHVVSGGGGISNIDELTITMNADDEIQTVGMINKNTAVGATAVLYDWEGTLQEYEDQQIETLHPEYIAHITDDCEESSIQKLVGNRNPGEIVYSIVPLIDAGLHVMNGDLIDGTGIYKDFYEHMLALYNLGHTSIFVSEATWQSLNTTNGKCGKFVLDTVNKTIRIPNIHGYTTIAQLESQLGDFVAAGLPNITGSITADSGSGTATGAFSLTATNLEPNAGNWGNSLRTYQFSATSSNSIYGNSNTVTPESTKVFAYLVVANSNKTPVEVDIDNIATELNACYSHRVVEFQAPTAGNNYTWYRKYADGWVEQGGYISANNIREISNAVTLPLAMANNNYSVTVTPQSAYRTDTSAWNMSIGYYAYSATTLIVNSYGLGSSDLQIGLSWEVKGMAAS